MIFNSSQRDSSCLYRQGVYLLLSILMFIYLLVIYSSAMDIYEHVIFIVLAAGSCAIGFFWLAYARLVLAVFVLSTLALSLYGGDLMAADENFFLRYMLSSQSAIAWMSTLFFCALFAYWAALIANQVWIAQMASALTWSAVAAGLIGLVVRWQESYLIEQDFGHIPISNLYEVFILFCLIAALIYLYYQQRYRVWQLGGFALLIISAAVLFLLWYSQARDAAQIQPLVPALQSYWMKIHVPANFVGYGAFAFAAMISTAYLLRHWCLRHNYPSVAARLPDEKLLNELTYRTIALGFFAFTIATILGALWAAEAWGSYWSWDPKETWALIVWLNYAAWLHTRLNGHANNVLMAWWSIIGLFITLFAFIGVNIFLSGLHSYGEL